MRKVKIEHNPPHDRNTLDWIGRNLTSDVSPALVESTQVLWKYHPIESWASQPCQDKGSKLRFSLLITPFIVCSFSVSEYFWPHMFGFIYTSIMYLVTELLFLLPSMTFFSGTLLSSNTSGPLPPPKYSYYLAQSPPPVILKAVPQDYTLSCTI